jgi:hypothetical protein
MDWYNGFSPAERDRSGRHSLKMSANGTWPRHPERCVACGRTDGLIQRHVEDYGAILTDRDNSIHLCRRCHAWVHARLTKPEKWNEYRKAVREGWRWTSGSKPKRLFGGVPSRFILDEIDAGKFCPDGRVAGNSKSPTPIDREKEAAWRAHQGFLNRISDWTADNVTITYPDRSANK